MVYCEAVVGVILRLRVRVRARVVLGSGFGPRVRVWVRVVWPDMAAVAGADHGSVRDLFQGQG